METYISCNKTFVYGITFTKKKSAQTLQGISVVQCKLLHVLFFFFKEKVISEKAWQT